MKYKKIILFLFLSIVSSLNAQITFSGIKLGADSSTIATTTIDESDTFDDAVLNPAWAWTDGVAGTYSIALGDLTISGDGSQGYSQYITKVIQGASWSIDITADCANENSYSIFFGVGAVSYRALQFNRANTNRIMRYDFVGAGYEVATEPCTGTAFIFRFNREGASIKSFYSEDGSTFYEVVTAAPTVFPATESVFINIGNTAVTPMVIHDFKVTK